MVASIAMAFRSYRLSAVTAIVALLALAIFRCPFGIQVVIGVIGSIGVSINAAIIIVTALQQDSLALRGDREAIAARVMAQSRHIISRSAVSCR